jgi:hypothetical protein
VCIYHESDLAIAEALATGVFDGLGQLRSRASRRASPTSTAAPSPRLRVVPVAACATATRLRALVDELNRYESARQLPVTRPIDATFLPLAFAWAAGEDLDEVLDEEELSGGDFVRNIRQLVDLLRQIGDAATDHATTHAARAAADALRGVVAHRAAPTPATTTASTWPTTSCTTRRSMTRTAGVTIAGAGVGELGRFPTTASLRSDAEAAEIVCASELATTTTARLLGGDLCRTSGPRRRGALRTADRTAGGRLLVVRLDDAPRTSRRPCDRATAHVVGGAARRGDERSVGGGVERRATRPSQRRPDRRRARRALPR